MHVKHKLLEILSSLHSKHFSKEHFTFTSGIVVINVVSGLITVVSGCNSVVGGVIVVVGGCIMVVGGVITVVGD